MTQVWRTPSTDLAATSAALVDLGEQPSEDGFSLRPIRPTDDAPWLHDWLHRDYARFWGMGQATQEDIRAYYQAMQLSGHARAYLGARCGQPAFLLEHYLPARDELGLHYPVREGDHGMHFALAPVQRPQHDFSIQVLLAILEIIFRDTSARRIVVEPDVRNAKIHILNCRAGFRYSRRLDLSTKSAYLGFCSRRQYAMARRRHRAPAS